MNFYELELLGLKRELPIIAVGRRTKLARFSLLGDVELVNALADEWAKRLKKYKMVKKKMINTSKRRIITFT